MWIWLTACSEPEPPPPAGATDTTPTPGTVPEPTEPTEPITEPPVFSAPPGVLLLCGGGSEGDVGDRSSWSTAYADLVENGDVSGDGLVQVAVLSAGDETDFIPSYFEWLGADEAFNLKVDSRAAADDPSLVDTFAHVDAVFLKGGDQGEYYDLWDGTVLELAYQGVYALGGGLGGTSAGAMSQSEYALAGSSDLISADVLEDSHTPYLRDASDGGSGIHPFGILPGTLIDTHFSNRGRLGRLAGTLAAAIDEGAPADLLGIGIDEQTCVTVRGTDASVAGVGAVVFLRSGPTPAVRVPGEPLVWTDLALDRLTAGWTASLAPFSAVPAPGAEAVAWDGTSAPATAGDWTADGARTDHEERFGQVVLRFPDPFGTRPGTDDPLLPDAVAVLDAHDSDRRGINEDALFRALYDHVGHTGVFLADGGLLERPDGAGAVVEIRGALATMLVDSSGVSSRSLSPSPSPWDVDGSLHAAGLSGLTLHVLSEQSYDFAARAPR